MSDLISKLSELRSTYNCFDENERDAYHTLSEAIKVLSAQTEQHGRVFKGIVVEYPTYSTYPEYEGKPYFSIKYTENGQEFIGYGTFKPEVLSEYLKEYFMPSAQPSFPQAHENDCISRAEAIKALCKAGCESKYCGISCDDVKAIEGLPSAQPTHDNTSNALKSLDCIDRQDAIDALHMHLMYRMGTDSNKKRLDEWINNLPSAQPEQRWIPCGKCIHADGKHRWCKVLDRTINEDYFCYWAEPYQGGGE